MNNYQVGGWYGGRQWDGTRLGNPGEIIVGSSSSGSGNATYDTMLNTQDAKVEEATKQLLEVAQGDYNYAAKWIETNYKNAVGTNDQATKDFLKSVASSLEAGSGRLVYDYQTGKYQVDTTFNTGTQRATDNQKLLLDRLAQDEQTDMVTLKRQAGMEIQATNSNLNQRGLVNAGRNDITGLGSQVVANQDADIQSRQDAITRAAQRGTQDVNIGTSNTLQDLSWAKQLGMEGLTTTARRGVIDAGQTKDQSLELAQLQKRRAEAAAQQARLAGLNTNLNYAKAALG